MIRVPGLDCHGTVVSISNACSSRKHCKSPQSIRDSDSFAVSYDKTCRTSIHLSLSSCSCRLFEGIITPWYISHVVVSSETASRDKSIAPSSGAGRLVTYQTFNQSVMHASVCCTTQAPSVCCLMSSLHAWPDLLIRPSFFGSRHPPDILYHLERFRVTERWRECPC